MPLPKSDKIWFNGEFLPWDDAKVHIGSHVIHYGTSVFEGIRCYSTPKGPAVFRLDAHTDRLFDSAKVYRMDLPFTPAEINRAILDTINANRMEACYIRPIAYRGYGELGVSPFTCPVDVAVMVWKWGQYLGPEALENGVDVCVSSWARFAPDTLPAMAKTGANYMNSQLIKMEAMKNGYAEGIALDSTGHVSEGSGENLFLVHKGTLLTPSLGSSVLLGITRDSVMALARRQGLEVVERSIPREMLYLADEVFFTGTAAELTPIRSVDRIQVGDGTRGPITESLQGAFFDILEGRAEDEFGWLTTVRQAGEPVAVESASQSAAK